MDEVIRRFEERGIRYLLIGGQAVRLEGLPRFSLDWDFYIPPRDAENLAAINRLLGAELDLPLLPLGEKGENAIQTYQTRWGVLQFHLGGPGLPPFDEAERRATLRQTENGTTVRSLCLKDLIDCKRASGRPQDLLDVEFLETKAGLK